MTTFRRERPRGRHSVSRRLPRRKGPAQFWFGLTVGSVVVAASCTGSMSARDRSSDDVRGVLADIDSAELVLSYRFAYRSISPMFMACLSGLDDIDGAVDADRRVVRLTSRQRAGEVFLLDDELVIDTELLGRVDNPDAFARFPLGDPQVLSALDDALGDSMSAAIGVGSFPAHPNDLVRALVPLASSVGGVDSGDVAIRGIRIVLDSSAYYEQFAEVAPVIDAYVAPDGGVRRLVVRVPDAAEPNTPGGESEGYAMDYVYDPSIELRVPSGSEIVSIDVAELPDEPASVPCEVNP